jgi:hypothetical protein
MRYYARIVDGGPAVPGAGCDLVHLDVFGDLIDRPAVLRLILSTSIGERFVDVCDAHDGAVGVDLARWSHPIAQAQCELEGALDGALTRVLSQQVPDA